MTSTPLDVVDWRRLTFDVYARVRAEASDDPAVAHQRWRDRRDEMFAGHPASPLSAQQRASFDGLPVRPYDPAMRFAVALGPAEPERLEVTTGTDGVVVFERIGRLEVAGVGTLDAWWHAGYGGGLFVPLRDGLAGRGGGTYGGGRYLLDTIKGADLGSAGQTADGDERLVVDLNFAYNPSCAYDAAWACPLAPPGNVVAAELGVGELAGNWLD